MWRNSHKADIGSWASLFIYSEIQPLIGAQNSYVPTSRDTPVLKFIPILSGLRSPCIPMQSGLMTINRAALMIRILPALFFVIFLSAVLFRPVMAEDSMLSCYDLDNPVSRLKLPAELKEVSGITLTGDNRLFAHDDEKGTVYQLDMKTGKIIKRFSILEKRWFGTDLVIEDFEDIAVVGKRFYMVTSSGVIYGFGEGKDGAKVEAVRHETFLNDLFDVEGLCYDPLTGSLLLACKEYPTEISLRQLLFSKKKTGLKLKPVYSFSLRNKALDKVPRFLIDSEPLKKKSSEKKFKPSAIARHPQSGTFFFLASKGKLLVEIGADGNVLDVARLPKKDHHQPEGLAFTSDNEMLISNEGVVGSASLRRYPMQKQHQASP